MDFWLNAVAAVVPWLAILMVASLLAWCVIDWVRALGRVVDRELKRGEP